MNPLKRILYLSSLIAVIGIFWLMPKINTAKDIRYTRVFEDTEFHTAQIENDSLLKTEPAKAKISLPDNMVREKDVALPKQIKRDSSENVKQSHQQEKKKYKSESISGDLKFRDVKAKMYGRAIHFSPEDFETADTLMTDSIDVLP